MKKEMTLEKAMERLEEITVKMQNESITIDESLKLFEEGTKLVSFCNEKLNGATLKISELSENEQDGINE